MRTLTKELIKSDYWADLKADVQDYAKALLDKDLQGQTMEEIFAEVNQRKGLVACVQILENLEADFNEELSEELKKLRAKNNQ